MGSSLQGRENIQLTIIDICVIQIVVAMIALL